MAAGLDPEAFWRVTPKEMAIHFDGAARRVKASQRLHAWAAYQTAILGRVDPKKFPKSFGELMGEKTKSRSVGISELKKLARSLPKKKG